MMFEKGNYDMALKAVGERLRIKPEMSLTTLFYREREQDVLN